MKMHERELSCQHEMYLVLPYIYVNVLSDCAATELLCELLCELFILFYL